jgi:hypothetical protein
MPTVTNAATWQLRQVRDHLTALVAELYACERRPGAERAADTIRAASADVTTAARRVEAALAQLCDRES